MQPDAIRRGRPKGTGIDDSPQLQKIAELIAADPALKPTTAIKALGVTDPSVIRRLRDKFNAFAAGAAIDGDGVANAPLDHSPAPPRDAATPPRVVAAAVKDSAYARTQKAPAVESRVTAAPETTATSKSTVADVPSASGSPAASARRPASLAAAPNDLMALWLGIGIQAFSTMVATQAALADTVMRSPMVSLALRQQIAFNEMAFALDPHRTAIAFGGRRD